MKLVEAKEAEISIDKIKPAQYNPRKDLKMGDKAYKDIKRSLEEFGLVDPLIWNKRTGNLVGGHQRLKVLQAEGAKKVRVRVVDIPLAKEKVLSITLNKVGGRWDKKKLASLLLEIEDDDLITTGFDEDEIDELIGEVENGIDGKIKFSEELDEENNYVVLVFRKSTDWLHAQTIFDLESVYSKRRNGKPWSKGMGRVLDGLKAIDTIRKSLRDS